MILHVLRFKFQKFKIFECLIFNHDIPLTESEKAIDKDDIDMVCSEIGKEWRQLCRRLGFSEGEIEQLRTDYFTSGVYETMYQVTVSLPLLTLPARGNFCHLLIIFANSFDTDQARHSVGPDQYPNS